MEKFITYPVELEMANLPGVLEIRSVSKFGLSVVTIVFEDAMGNYLPRQLISEKLKSAIKKIPEGFGTPEMGPITTGLGEIYQYHIRRGRCLQRQVFFTGFEDHPGLDRKTATLWHPRGGGSKYPGGGT